MNISRHSVAVACLVTNQNDGILMIRSPKRGWEYPGGVVEIGENLIDAAEREVFEETGCVIEVGRLATVHTNLDSAVVGFGFFATYKSGTLTTSVESLEVEWVPKDSALNRVTFLPIRQRIEDMFSFTGSVIYRSYFRDPYVVQHEQLL